VFPRLDPRGSKQPRPVWFRRGGAQHIKGLANIGLGGISNAIRFFLVMANAPAMAPTHGPDFDAKVDDRQLNDVEGDSKETQVVQTGSAGIGFRLSDL
jgi:hypothetical protein